MAMENHIYLFIILYNHMEKFNSIAVEDYIFCKTHLNSDFDNTLKYEERKSVCLVCGSKKWNFIILKKDKEDCYGEESIHFIQVS